MLKTNLSRQNDRSLRRPLAIFKKMFIIYTIQLNKNEARNYSNEDERAKGTDDKGVVPGDREDDLPDASSVSFLPHLAAALQFIKTAQEEKVWGKWENYSFSFYICLIHKWSMRLNGEVWS